MIRLNAIAQDRMTLPAFYAAGNSVL